MIGGKRTEDRCSAEEFPTLLSELRRVERIVLETTGKDLTFSDGKSGWLLFNLRGLRAGVFSVGPRGCRGGGGNFACSLRFNADIIRTVGEEGFLPTVAHEYAHAVVHALKNSRKREGGLDFSPHGALWKSLMETFGYRPQRCHDYPVLPARKGKVFDYRCGRCRKDYRLGLIRHRRLEKHPGYLVCGSCRGPLLPEEKVRPEF